MLLAETDAGVIVLKSSVLPLLAMLSPIILLNGVSGEAAPQFCAACTAAPTPFQAPIANIQNLGMNIAGIVRPFAGPMQSVSPLEYDIPKGATQSFGFSPEQKVPRNLWALEAIKYFDPSLRPPNWNPATDPLVGLTRYFDASELSDYLKQNPIQSQVQEPAPELEEGHWLPDLNLGGRV